jgi:hypothetical protein
VDGSEEKEPPLQAHEHGDDADVENEMGAVRGPTPIAIVNSPIAVPRSANVCAANPTPNDSRALFSLDSEEGRAMHSLAEEWGCDPSERHLDRGPAGEARARAAAHRPAGPAVEARGLDRNGAAGPRGLLREFHRPPPELAELGREDLAILATHAGEARATSGRNYFGGA